MNTNYLNSPAELKFAAKAGVVEGYAAVFNNRDLGGDVILPGAFRKFSKTRDGKVLMLYQHDTRSPIGKADVAQDSRGLSFKAELLMDDATAARAYNHMKAGVLDGMSIGFEILPDGSERKGDRRELSALHLHEVSAVTWGMNPLARVEVVKTAAECANVRELEQLLRETPTLQLSSRKAKAAAGLLWPLLSARDVQEGARDEPAEFVKHFANVLDNLNHILKGN